MDKSIQKIIMAFKSGEFDSVAELVKQSIDKGTDPSIILEATTEAILLDLSEISIAKMEIALEDSIGSIKS